MKYQNQIVKKRPDLSSVFSTDEGYSHEEWVCRVHSTIFHNKPDHEVNISKEIKFSKEAGEALVQQITQTFEETERKQGL